MARPHRDNAGVASRQRFRQQFHHRQVQLIPLGQRQVRQAEKVREEPRQIGLVQQAERYRRFAHALLLLGLGDQDLLQLFPGEQALFNERLPDQSGGRGGKGRHLG